MATVKAESGSGFVALGEALWAGPGELMLATGPLHYFRGDDTGGDGDHSIAEDH